jgi:hypothetical protein
VWDDFENLSLSNYAAWKGRICDGLQKILNGTEVAYSGTFLRFSGRVSEKTRKPLVKSVSWPEGRRFFSRLGQPEKVMYKPIV